MEDESAVREKKIIGILKQEEDDGENLASAARKQIEYLLLEKKGYAAGEVKKNFIFEVALDKERTTSSVDFIVTIEGKRAMIIKCCAGSLSSRERQAIAAARVISTPPVPLAVVSDPVSAEVLDVTSGKVIGEGFGAIPLREQIAALLCENQPAALSPGRIEKEKRILLAFDAIRCMVPQGGNGGVQIGPEPGKKKKSQC